MTAAFEKVETFWEYIYSCQRFLLSSPRFPKAISKLVNPLLKNKILEVTKLKAFPDDKLC